MQRFNCAIPRTLSWCLPWTILGRGAALVMGLAAVCSTALAQPVTVLPGNLSTSGNGRAPQGTRAYIRTVYLITPSDMTASGFGASAVGSVGWRWNAAGAAAAGVAQSAETTGDIKIYLQSTADTAYTKGTNFTTALSGMTLVTNGTITIPASADEINIDVPTGGTGTSAFSTVAGQGVYVAFDYHTTTDLATPLGAPTVICLNTVGSFLATYQSQTAVGTTMTTSTFRPETRFAPNLAGMGACCHDDGTCLVGLVSDCNSPYLRQLAGTSCNGPSSTCPVDVGACCDLGSAACTYTAGTVCPTGSASLGAGSTCSPTNTCPSVSACCRPDGSCTFGSSVDCATAPAGQYQFNTTTCTGQVCPIPGTCCLPNGQCGVLAQFYCEGAVGGVFAASATPCSPANCPQPGACCLAQGGCIAVLTAECTSAGGAFGGAGVLCALGNCWTGPTLYHNGSIVTHPGQGTGLADVSQLPAGGTTIGVGFAGGFRVAEDFVVPAGQSWTITRFRAAGYLTGAANNANPFTTMVLQIWDRDPRNPLAVAVWGDLTTNVLDTADTVFSNIYRTTVAAGLLDFQRAVYAPIVNVPNVHLPAGTYWIEWGSVNGGFIPAVTTNNFIPFGNAIQWTGATYNAAADASYDSAHFSGGKPVNMPFVLEGAVGACCLPDGTCTASVPGTPTSTCATGTLVASATCLPTSTCPTASLGGCCTTASGTCLATQVTQAACEGTAGNHWLGVGIACTAGNCPVPNPTGACCNGLGGCSTQTAANCTLAGAYRGDNSVCGSTVCGICCRGATCNASIFTSAGCTTTGTAAGHAYVTGACSGSHFTPCCEADYNKSGGQQTVSDIFNFLTDWFAHSLYAFPGGNGTSTQGPSGGVPAVAQIFNFLTDWFGPHCP